MGGEERGDVRSQRLRVWINEGVSLLPSWETPVVCAELGEPRAVSAPLSFACPPGRGRISKSQGARCVSSEALVKATCWSPADADGFQRDTHQFVWGTDSGRGSSFPRGCFPGESALGSQLHKHR